MRDIRALKQFMSKDIFPIIPNIENKNVARHIYPLKQRQVDNLLNNMPGCVSKAIVFGSSHTWQCNIDSDIDIAVSVDGNDAIRSLVRTDISRLCNYGCDVVFLDEIQESEKIAGEIQKGVVIYERPVQ